jgi:hypothetical protein
MSVIKFNATVDTKSTYYQLHQKINFYRAVVTRENSRELKAEFFADLDVTSHGSTLYRDLKNSGICKTLTLYPDSILNDNEE